MNDMPERVFVDPDIRFPECEKQYGCDVEYRRTDAPPTVAEALQCPEVQALVEAADKATVEATPTDERDGPVWVLVPAADWLALERALAPFTGE